MLETNRGKIKQNTKSISPDWAKKSTKGPNAKDKTRTIRSENTKYGTTTLKNITIRYEYGTTTL